MKYLFTIAMLLLAVFTNAQDCTDDAIAFQNELNEQYADADKSPLTQEDFEVFKSLEFYPVDTDFCVTAKLERTPDEKPFAMQTSTSRKPTYVKYGVLHFTLQGKECRLDVFQNVKLSKIKKYKNSLFLPFTDLTSGMDSYGGGRYIDLTIPEGDILVLNFNTAYNPYCAYNHNYSCPVPPQQNDLQVAITAGVKKHDKK